MSQGFWRNNLSVIIFIQQQPETPGSHTPTGWEGCQEVTDQSLGLCDWGFRL